MILDRIDRGGAYLLLFAFLVGLNSCERELFSDRYHSAGKFTTRTVAETEALKVLVDGFSTLPASGIYKVKYEFDDTQLPSGKSSFKKHAIWYEKRTGQLAVEFDIFSGTSCRWVSVDELTLQKIADSGLGLEGANQFVTPANQQENCFK
jgi:hypothetical protein